MHASIRIEDDALSGSAEDAEREVHIPLTMPSGRSAARSIAAPEPLIDPDESLVRLRAVTLEELSTDDEEESAPPPPLAAAARWRAPHVIILVSLVALAVTFGLALLRDRTRDGALFRSAQAKRARAAVTVMSAPPPVPMPTAKSAEPESTPAPPAELAAIAEASAHDAAKNERFEAQVALEMGDVLRAEKVALHAVEHDPSEADGWLLLTAAQLELNRVEASRASLRACADRAKNGPHWECVALLHDNGPN